ncbi:MAG: DNA topoisomerase IB [Nonlabens sp.]
MTLTPTQIATALTEPESAAMLADLVYVQDHHLNIYRKKQGRGYSYLIENNDRIKDKNILKRLKSLVIPPAWQKVRISSLENGHLQVVGRDSKNRKVYLYHDLWNILRNQTKFFKMSAFAKALPSIRKQLEKDLTLGGMPRRKCLALVVSIMDETYIRVGSSQYARRNKTYGLSTLRMRHVDHNDSNVVFKFTGKKSVQQSKVIDDPQLTKLIKQCEEIPGRELFQYYDRDGSHHSIDSGMINNYIQEISKTIFTAKDFRTWGASREFFEFVIDLPFEKAASQLDSNILQGYDAAAEALGNTRSVCRQYYVHPQLPKAYLEGELEQYKSFLDARNDKPYFSASEQCVLKIIEQYEIELN